MLEVHVEIKEDLNVSLPRYKRLGVQIWEQLFEVKYRPMPRGPLFAPKVDKTDA